MRSLGKVLLVLVACLVELALFAGGAVLAFSGFADQNAARYDYKVGFKHPGDDCGNNELSVDVTTGDPLQCLSSGSGSLPGFSDEQQSEVVGLSKQLGEGGLTGAEQDQVQKRVDRIADSLPPDRRPQHPWLWGWKLGVLGLLAVLTALVAAGLVIDPD
ncbi:hypothetical protein E0H73_09275 [Kribbella pittospori]|uniref:Uncharacterized protein n=1 Tax=Kribbella pittospori TaxID=722689 RepID=A0A4R0L712_9ACTN|nr:hypothetical protein [Kribbella pittospori]TCC64565.1 hypothetical protein E0H73_09275 [Kribbella pittospori]